MKVLITDYANKLDTLPELIVKKEFEFAWRYETGVYQLAKYPTKTYLHNKLDELAFMNGNEVWIHKDEVSIQLVD
jgi:hypothetical protein